MRIFGNRFRVTHCRSQEKEEEFAKCLDLKELTKATLLDDELIN